MRVLIVEDETAACINLKEILFNLYPEFEIAGVTESISQTVRFLVKHPDIDLIFMDIHLSDGSAFTLFSTITIDTPVIFTTAYDKYAIEAFQVNSIGYLLKPIEEKALIRAVNKFKKINTQERISYMNRINSFISPDRIVEKMLVSCKDKLIPVDIKEIACFYTYNEQTRLILRNGESYNYNKPLDQIYTSLDPGRFYRANKQYILSKDSIRDITIWFDNRLLINLCTEVPEKIFVSKNKAADFKKWIV